MQLGVISAVCSKGVLLMSHIATRSQAAISKTDITAIAVMAKEDAAKGNKVINASIGTFYDDDRKLGEVPLIKKALKDYVPSSLGYPSVYGDQAYLKGIRTFMFGDKEKEIDSLYTIFGGASIGGTGSISIAFNVFNEAGDSVLLQSVMWTNYMLIAKKAGLGHETYTMFDENDKLNLGDIKKKIEERFASCGRAFLVLNDPCQNPTGYCMDEEEYKALFELLNEEGKKGKLTVLFDVAYSAFYAVPGHHFALNDELVKGKPSFLPLIAFSCSKLFGLYGLRIGALFALCQNQEERDAVAGSFGAEARGTYSVPVGAPQVAVAKVLSDPSLKEELWTEINKNTECLSKRSKALLAKMDELGIPHYPYMSGFFISIKVKDAYGLHKELMARHMYVVPMNETSVRIAFGGLSVEDGYTLLTNIKEIISQK